MEFMLADAGAVVVVTEDALRPRLPALDAVVVSLDGERAAIDATPADPTLAGPKPLRRLDTREYNNTVRDLLGDTTGPASARFAFGTASPPSAGADNT